jgi:hypothetical protein
VIIPDTSAAGTSGEEYEVVASRFDGRAGMIATNFEAAPFLIEPQRSHPSLTIPTIPDLMIETSPFYFHDDLSIRASQVDGQSDIPGEWDRAHLPNNCNVLQPDWSS